MQSTSVTTRPKKTPLFSTDPRWIIEFRLAKSGMLWKRSGDFIYSKNVPIPPMEKSEAEEAAVKRAGMYPAMEYRVRELRAGE